MAHVTLTANDPEPSLMSLVRDDLGRLWRRWPEGYWLREDDSEATEDDDPESWIKVAGNYGPVTLISGRQPQVRESHVTLTEFLLARIAEDEVAARDDDYHLAAHAKKCGYSQIEWGDDCSCGVPARVLAECAAKRAIIAFHESWPMLVQTPAKFEPIKDGDLDNYTYRMSQEIAWLTTREYVARFGIDPPTAPMLAALALPYADHPDYLPEWKP